MSSLKDTGSKRQFDPLGYMYNTDPKVFSRTNLEGQTTLKTFTLPLVSNCCHQARTPHSSKMGPSSFPDKKYTPLHDVSILFQIR